MGKCNFSFGRFYTLELGKRLGSSIDEDQLWIHLLHNATYYIEVHDGNFYLGFMNPNLPLEYALVTTGGEPSFYWFFKTTEVEHLNLPSRPCNPSPGYNFQVYRFWCSDKKKGFFSTERIILWSSHLIFRLVFDSMPLIRWHQTWPTSDRINSYLGRSVAEQNGTDGATKICRDAHRLPNSS